MKTFQKLFFISLFIIVLVSCGETKKENRVDTAEEIEEALSVRSQDIPVSDERNVAETAMANVDFATLVKALKSTDMVSELELMKSITLFAPTNEAFDKLPETRVADLMAPQGRNDMTNILAYHVVEGTYEKESLLSSIQKSNDGNLRLKTLQGGFITLTLVDDKISITNEKGTVSTVVMPDIEATNGIVHGINQVLIPQ